MVRLGELERVVMDCMWAAGHPMTVRDVYEALLSTRQIAYTTVATTMQRLAKKGLLNQERGDRAHLFTPAASRGAMFAELLNDALGVAGGDPGVIVRFLDELDPEARAALRDALRENPST